MVTEIAVHVVSCSGWLVASQWD